MVIVVMLKCKTSYIIMKFPLFIGLPSYNKITFLSLKIVFVLAISIDPIEMPQHAAFHLGLHCLPKNASRSRLTSIQSDVFSCYL